MFKIGNKVDAYRPLNTVYDFWWNLKQLEKINIDIFSKDEQ